MDVRIQIHGKKDRLVSSIDEAFELARTNDDMWRISWTDHQRKEHICFRRITRTRSTIVWKYEPQSIIEH